jgi:hypothetical protein
MAAIYLIKIMIRLVCMADITEYILSQEKLG